MGRQVDIDDILDAREVAKMVGFAHRTSVYTYLGRPSANFPDSLEMHGNCRHWHRDDIAAWIEERRIKREAAAAARAAQSGGKNISEVSENSSSSPGSGV